MKYSFVLCTNKMFRVCKRFDAKALTFNSLNRIPIIETSYEMQS